MTVTVTVEDEELQRFLAQLPETLTTKVRQMLGNAALKAQRAVIDNFNHTGATGADKLTSRTGLLARSIRTTITPTGTPLSQISAAVHTDVIYAPIHEQGGTITAKRAYAGVPGGPYLNIPLPDNLTPAGVMRKNAGEVFSQGGYLVRSRLGNWLVMDVNGKPMFVLKRSVTIKPRLGMVKAAEDQMVNVLNELRAMSLQ